MLLRYIARYIALLAITAICSFSMLSFLVGVVHFIADRQLADIQDIPVYPNAQLITDAGFSTQDKQSCFNRLYKVPDEPQAIHEFYKNTLLYNQNILKRGWVGDGLYYPDTESVNFYRKAGGHFQKLEIATVEQVDQTLLTLKLCTIR
jgi:hypothetical protein